MRFKPIMAFDYILDGCIYVYHTDGKTLIGPTFKGNISIDPEIQDRSRITVSYLNIVDPDQFGLIWYQHIYDYEFDDDINLKNALADLILEYQAVYATFSKKIPFHKVYPIAKYFGKFIPKYPTLKELKPIFDFQNKHKEKK